MQDARAERAPESVERFVKQMLVVYKAVKLYPPASDIPRDSAGDLVKLLRVLLRDHPELRFMVSKEALLYGGIPVLPDQAPFEALAREFYNQQLADVRFHASVSAKEIIGFLRVLQEPPAEVQASGGFDQRLWDQQIDGVTVRTVSTKVVDTVLESDAPGVDEDEPWPPPHERIDELVEAAYGARPRDQRMLVRFVQSPRLVSRYLSELASSGRGGRPLVNLVAGRVVSLAHAAYAELAEEQPALFRSVAEGLLGLTPELRREVLVQRLLPEARLDDAVAGVLRQFELGELCQALVEGTDLDPVSQNGLSRAIRNLAVISLRPRDEVLGAAEAALREAGADEKTVAAVLESAAPTRLRVPPSADGRVESVESVLKLVDLAPVAREAVDADIVELREEVANGISDGDVMLALVTLVAIERRPEVFASLMAVIEDRLGMLLDWGEYADAADAAAAFAAMEGDETLDEAQRERVVSALVAMAATEHMRELSAALRRHPAGSPEHDACKRLLSTLGAYTVGPLLEVLAEEPDMAVRKSLVDLISGMARRHVHALGERVSDPRWYFVRNVVAILGSTRSPEALTFLSRTLRHSDARVRRETIRAVASIRDRLAEEMLMAALSDEDPQNVGLAARSLGVVGSRVAFGALSAVARGEGRGNREPSARIEAIEALGRLGIPEAAEVLEGIARQRTIIRSARAREIRAAAEGALATLRAGGEGGAR